MLSRIIKNNIKNYYQREKNRDKRKRDIGK